MVSGVAAPRVLVWAWACQAVARGHTARLRRRLRRGSLLSLRERRLVRAVGIEPTRRCHRGILSPLRLPVPPRPLYPRDQVLSAFPEQVELGIMSAKRAPKLYARAAAKAKPQCRHRGLL